VLKHTKRENKKIAKLEGHRSLPPLEKLSEGLRERMPVDRIHKPFFQAAIGLTLQHGN